MFAPDVVAERACQKKTLSRLGLADHNARGRIGGHTALDSRRRRRLHVLTPKSCECRLRQTRTAPAPRSAPGERRGHRRDRSATAGPHLLPCRGQPAGRRANHRHSAPAPLIRASGRDKFGSPRASLHWPSPAFLRERKDACDSKCGQYDRPSVRQGRTDRDPWSAAAWQNSRASESSDSMAYHSDSSAWKGVRVSRSRAMTSSTRARNSCSRSSRRSISSHAERNSSGACFGLQPLAATRI